MDAIEFCKSLCERITPEEWCALECADNKLYINDHNRLALLEMREVSQRANESSLDSCIALGGESETGVNIDAESAAALEGALQAFLDEYMAEAPEGHKWIILASLYLTYVAKRPMHPLARAGVTVEKRDGRKVFLCPNKIVGDNPICDACVCVPA